MAAFVVRVGCFTSQGHRPNNEDRFVVDPTNQLYMVADGMGGHAQGEQASGMAAEIIPRAVQDRLAAQQPPGEAVQQALAEANQAIIEAGRKGAVGRPMGTTAVLAVHQANQVYVAGLGDSRAYLVRDGQVEQLTVDHSVADAMQRHGALTPEQARSSPWKHVLYKFLGCAEMAEGAEVRPFTPQAGDRLLLASDGLTNHVSDDDLRDEVCSFPDPQQLAEYLVRLALQHGSRDNVTCVVVAFDPE
jgi:protein phosphatase